MPHSKRSTNLQECWYVILWPLFSYNATKCEIQAVHNLVKNQQKLLLQKSVSSHFSYILMNIMAYHRKGAPRGYEKYIALKLTWEIWNWMLLKFSFTFKNYKWSIISKVWNVCCKFAWISKHISQLMKKIWSAF